MSYRIIAISVFEKQFKRLYKKYPSLKSDFKELIEQLNSNPTSGIPLGNNCFKIRLKINSKNKGKSAGARVITHVYLSNETIYLLSIYDKSELESITDKEIKDLLSQINNLE